MFHSFNHSFGRLRDSPLIYIYDTEGANSTWAEKGKKRVGGGERVKEKRPTAITHRDTTPFTGDPLH